MSEMSEEEKVLARESVGYILKENVVMSEEEKVLARESVGYILKENVVKVVFTKKDGSEREMLCTLNQKLLPPREDGGDEEAPKTKNPDQINVWDLEKGAWRSFMIDSMISFEVVEDPDADFEEIESLELPDEALVIYEAMNNLRDAILFALYKPRQINYVQLTGDAEDQRKEIDELKEHLEGIL